MVREHETLLSRAVKIHPRAEALTQNLRLLNERSMLSLRLAEAAWEKAERLETPRAEEGNNSGYLSHCQSRGGLPGS